MDILQLFSNQYLPAKGFPDADEFLTSDEIIEMMGQHEPEFLLPSEEVLIKAWRLKRASTPEDMPVEPLQLGEKKTHLNLWMEEQGYKCEAIEGMKVVWLLKRK